MPERFKVVFTMQGTIQVLGFTFTLFCSAGISGGAGVSIDAASWRVGCGCRRSY